VPDLLPEAIWTGLEPGKRACYDDDRIDHHSRLLAQPQGPACRRPDQGQPAGPYPARARTSGRHRR
jgi:hypothetical protein